jgi:hypothetical protein
MNNKPITKEQKRAAALRDNLLKRKPVKKPAKSDDNTKKDK